MKRWAKAAQQTVGRLGGRQVPSVGLTIRTNIVHEGAVLPVRDSGLRVEHMFGACSSPSRANSS